MSERRRERLDFWQNITIAALTVSAVLLLAQAGILGQIWEIVGGYVRVFPDSVTIAPSVTGETVVAVPVRLVVSGNYGRYANVTMTTNDLAFYPVSRLLRDALEELAEGVDLRRRGREPEEIGSEAFLNALAPPSLCCDFLRPLPMTLLAGLTGGEVFREDEVRYAVLSQEPEQEQIALYLWDGAGRFLRMETELAGEEFQSASEAYALGGAAFAMDRIREDPLYGGISPLSILPDSLPTLPILSVGEGTTSTEQILTALQFNPLTNSRYWESNGTEVIMESGRSVRLRSDGSISYQSGGQGDLRIESAEEAPTVWECAAGCKALLDAVAPGGSASLYPASIRRKDSLLILRFGYQTQGVPILLPDGGDAAVVTMDGGSVVSLEVRPRTYTVTETASLLLPLPQAMGIAGLHPGRELSLAYADSGQGEAAALWVLQAPMDQKAASPKPPDG